MINRYLTVLCYLCLALLLSSCSKTDILDHQIQQPQLTVEQFFDGPLRAYGVVKNRSGNVTRHFSAEIQASWQSNTNDDTVTGKAAAKDLVGTLDETFYFDDGEVQKRVWTLTKVGDGQFIAGANDVIGQHRMTTKGNALFMNYQLQITYKGAPLEINVRDRMYLVSPNRIINESMFFKWGFNVGSVQLVIEKIQ